jgi:glycosyltransferase involved in cell wall biosynthesis
LETRVLNVSNGDVIGGRFNNYRLWHELKENGIDSRHVVWRPRARGDRITPMLPYPGSRILTRLVEKVEYALSLQSVLHLQSFFLPAQRAFRACDVVHYHIIHDGYFSLLALPFLTGRKPSIWTFHDPWPMTGHCIYPLDCERWKTGCGNCPDLERPFAMRRDRTHRQFTLKQSLYARTNADIVVASPWMSRMMEQSPLGRSWRRHVIPFWFDVERFRPLPQAPARQRLGIVGDVAVICCRTIDTPFKGLPYLIEALEQLDPSRNLCIVALDETGLRDRLRDRHQIIELGWTDDEDRILDAYAASDFFVMPSTAEAFGMMAIEAMACGRPVLSFEGTSLPEITFAPEAGLAVPMRDSGALSRAMTRWIEDPAEVVQRGRRSRELAVAHYDARQHAQRMADLYRSVHDRHRGASQNQC